MSQGLDLLNRHLNGEELDAVEKLQLSDWVCASAENANLAAELTCLEQSIYANLKHQSRHSLIGIEHEGFSLLTAPRHEDAQPTETPIGFRTLRSVAGYLLIEYLHTKAGKITAVAAALLLGVAVSIALLVSGPSSEPTHLTQQSTPAPTATEMQPVVATLTAEQDAVWDRRPGQDLYAGQRFTLTRGFAEITTHRGAIAILEAPATVELLDSNAIYLHQGKLLGICETPRSKGFVVRTEAAEVTDLGTVFGVAVEAERIVATVFTGKVDVTAGDGRPQPLVANQLATLPTDGSARAFVIEERLAQNFGALRGWMLTETLALPGTGQDIEVGQIDPNWQIVATDGKPLAEPKAAYVFDPTIFESTTRQNLEFLPNERGVSQWITPILNAAGARAARYQSVTYQATFDTGGLDPATLKLALRVLADNGITAIELNGRQVAVPPHNAGSTFVEMVPVAIEDGFIPGRNALTIHTQRYRDARTHAYWTGLRAELELTGQRQRAEANP